MKRRKEEGNKEGRVRGCRKKDEKRSAETNRAEKKTYTPNAHTNMARMHMV